MYGEEGTLFILTEHIYIFVSSQRFRVFVDIFK